MLPLSMIDAILMNSLSQMCYKMADVLGVGAQ